MLDIEGTIAIVVPKQFIFNPEWIFVVSSVSAVV